MPQIGDNFTYRGPKFLDDRTIFDSIEDMKNFPESSLPDVFKSYVNGIEYEFKRTNTLDGTTGKWREYKVSSGGGHVLSDTEPEDTNLIWFDSNYDENNISINDSVLKELMDIMSSQRNELNTLKNTCSTLTATVEYLETRVKYLEEHGVTTDDNISGAFLLEDGSSLLLEDGSYLKLESFTEETITQAVLLEDSNPLLLENSNYLKLEN